MKKLEKKKKKKKKKKRKKNKKKNAVGSEASASVSMPLLEVCKTTPVICILAQHKDQ